MKIVHVVDSMDPSTGGPPAVISRLAAAQATILGDGGSVTVLAHEQAPERQKHFEASIRGVPGIARVWFASLPREGASWSQRRQYTNRLQQFVRGADAVHLHGVWDALLWRTARAARRLGVPYFITPHGMLDPWALRQGKWKKKLALALGFRSMLQRAACFHLLNSDEANLIAPLKLATPLRIIPNGVFLEEIEPLPAPGGFREKHPELEDQPFILFLSRLHYKKGLDYLADAFARIAAQRPQMQLVVAGPDDGARSDFENRIRKSELQARVHLVGPIYGRDKFTAIVDAACFCLPSRQEGFSIAILEALACGTPVVISENCHFPEVAEAGAGEVVKLNAESIADGLDRVLSNESRQMQLGRAGRELVRSRYTWPVIAGAVVDMYRSALRSAK